MVAGQASPSQMSKHGSLEEGPRDRLQRRMHRAYLKEKTCQVKEKPGLQLTTQSFHSAMSYSCSALGREGCRLLLQSGNMNVERAGSGVSGRLRG